MFWIDLPSSHIQNWELMLVKNSTWLFKVPDYYKMFFLMLSQGLLDFFGSSVQLYILLSHYLRLSPFKS